LPKGYCFERDTGGEQRCGTFGTSILPAYPSCNFDLPNPNHAAVNVAMCILGLVVSIETSALDEIIAMTGGKKTAGDVDEIGAKPETLNEVMKMVCLNSMPNVDAWERCGLKVLPGDLVS